VAALAHGDAAYRLIAAGADVGFVTPHDAPGTSAIVAAIAADRTSGPPVRVLADLVVFLDDAPGAARARWQRLDEAAGREFVSDAEIFAGTSSELADLLQQWQDAGADGFRLRPATLPHDLRQITEGLVPELQRRGAFRTGYPGATLRDTLGLARPANRYSTAGTTNQDRS
jgi:alkanesulfonate monooxygenase SsuD/methylene tetrahydromethanopterin reductase-like flavin-dependent oxidoreductase (luciferase family)